MNRLNTSGDRQWSRARKSLCSGVPSLVATGDWKSCVMSSNSVDRMMDRYD